MAAPTTTTTPPQTLRIGVMMQEVQLSDITGVDILGNISHEYLTEVSSMFPEYADYLTTAHPMTFYYLSTTLSPTICTPGMKILPNMTYDDCPRDLDILIIGGPQLSSRPEQADKFMKEMWGQTKVVLTTCVGSLWLASSGVLKGRKCTTNRFALPVARQLYPEVEWLDQRWVVDGDGPCHLWTSGGAGAGIDMIGAYALEKFPQNLVKDLALELLDFDPEARGQFYREKSLHA
ncbi:MAG: hypothetical protein MMC33_000194 [Icmadophila ericetorum]|nr:hypothetical protein [Icmadophila ericetorum]